MNCPACQSPVDDRSYRCKECQQICSYPRLLWRYRHSISIVIFATLVLLGYAYVGGIVTVSYAGLRDGALVSDAATRQWLGLSDSGWFCEEPHHKGEILHLRHKVFQAKDVIVFIHGFIGNYVNTWGKPRILLDDPRFNRNYDFVFYSFKTALVGDLPAFQEEAAKLERELTKLEENYRTITLVTHSKGGLLAMRSLVNRVAKYPEMQPYKLHRIVMFVPVTENVSLNKHPDIVKLLASKSIDIHQMEANTYSELGKVKADLTNLLHPNDSIGEERKQRLLKDVIDRLYVINAEGDGVVDVNEKGEKIVYEPLSHLNEQPNLGPRRLETLRYSDIGGPEEDHRLIKNPAYAHTIVVKMGEQESFAFFNRFEELLWERIGSPPRQATVDIEQLRQNLHDRIDESVFEMNRFVVEKDPMLGLCWRDIHDAIYDRFENEPQADRQDKIEAFTKQVYYIYIFLDMYAKMDDLRSRGLLSQNDEKLAEWKKSWLPNLVGSDVGHWMLDHNLMDYYSEQMRNDLKDAATKSESATR
jgi:hypothetical protein